MAAVFHQLVPRRQIIKSHAATEQVTEDGRYLFTGQITVRNLGFLAIMKTLIIKPQVPLALQGVPGRLVHKSLKSLRLPAAFILSAAPHQKQDQYELIGGTSMSLPQVAGMVALSKAVFAGTGLFHMSPPASTSLD